MAERFYLSALVDFVDEASRATYEPSNVDAMMRTLVDMGVRRVYWIHYGKEDDGFMWRGDMPDYQTLNATVRALGQPIRAAVQAARRHGLEIYGFVKPYETGLSMIYPQGSSEAKQYGLLPHLGSSLPVLTRFVQESPHMRIRRRMDDLPPNLESTPIGAIRLYKRDHNPTRIRQENLEIWTSATNYRYTRKQVAFDCADQVVSAPCDFTDFEGNVLAAAGQPVRALTLSGLDLRDPYILVTTNLDQGDPDFENAALHMLEAHGPDGSALPISVGTGRSVWCAKQVDFRNWGIEFDNGFGRAVVQLDAPSRSGKAGFVALTRGRNEYLPAALCCAYPEVQRYWLSMVQECLDAGVDGIDFRIENHCTHTDDPFAYGFNDILLDEYRRRHGASGALNLDLLAEMRGAHYDRFLRAAKALIASYGKRMQIHLNVEFLRPVPRPSRYIAHPWNIRFNWKGWLEEGLADEATLRTFQYTPDFVLNDPFSQEVIAECQKRHIPMHYNRYLSRPPAQYVQELEQIYKDGRFETFIVYETASFMTPDDHGGVTTFGGWFEAIRDKARSLGLVD